LSKHFFEGLFLTGHYEGAQNALAFSEEGVFVVFRDVVELGEQLWFLPLQ